MIVGYHLIWTVYGYWLPNDPRGSWSDFVGAWELLRYGPATKTSTTKSVAYTEHDQRLRREAKKALKYSPVLFSGLQARDEDFARAIAYVEQNPLKEGKPRQRWSFITPFAV